MCAIAYLIHSIACQSISCEPTRTRPTDVDISSLRACGALNTRKARVRLASICVNKNTRVKGIPCKRRRTSNIPHQDTCVGCILSAQNCFHCTSFLHAGQFVCSLCPCFLCLPHNWQSKWTTLTTPPIHSPQGRDQCCSSSPQRNSQHTASLHASE